MTETMRYFGFEDLPPEMTREYPLMETPVGSVCIHCGETFTEGDKGVKDAGGSLLHYPCMMRLITGSVAHVEGQCSCFVPESACGDPEGLTTRQAAEAAFTAYMQKRGVLVIDEGIDLERDGIDICEPGTCHR